MFRAAAPPQPQVLNIVFNDGGLGDYICRIPAVRTLAQSHPHLTLRIWVPHFFLTLARFWLSYLPAIEVHARETWPDRRQPHEPSIDFHSNLVRPNKIHLTDHAFLIVLGRLPSPEEAKLPHFPTATQSRKPYVVLTVAYTSQTRMWLTAEAAKVRDYFLTRGKEVVFLGKSEVEQGYSAKFDKTLTAGCTDLIDKTNLMQAAEVLSGAECVFGVDNGLLHLAACSKTNIVAGFTTVRPEHREFMRPGGGQTAYVVPGPKLECRFCQSNMRTFGHDFRKCYYGDFACLPYMAGESFLAAYEGFAKQEEVCSTE